MNVQLQLENIHIKREDKSLITNLHCQWQGGDFVQLEGHNGIGKTSLLRVIAGLASPREGIVRWQGVDIRKQRESYTENLLYLGHQSGIKPELTPWENLAFYQQVSPSLQGQDILWDVLDKVGLFGREDLPAGLLSAGQQKRIALARLYLSQAPLWVLDEPFTAIDKEGVANLTALFEQHTAQGGLVILTSHQDIPSYKLTTLHLAPYKFSGNE